MKLLGTVTPTGVPYENFVEVRPQQHAKYTAGFLGRTEDKVLLKLLTEGANGKPQKPAPGRWIQNFHKERFLMHEDDGAIFYRDLPHFILREDIGAAGRFDFDLDLTGVNSWQLNIVVKWYLELMNMPSAYSGGTTDDAIIDAALQRVNPALEEFWGGYALECGPIIVQPIPIHTKVVRVQTTGDAHFKVFVYPDSTLTIDMKRDMFGLEVPTKGEEVNMENQIWLMRETLTFDKWFSGDTKQRGNGPHEYGHMMGLTHDLGDLDSVMYSNLGRGSPPDIDDYKEYKYGGKNHPYASHFKLAKLWVDQILSTEVFPGSTIDCVIVP